MYIMEMEFDNNKIETENFITIEDIYDNLKRAFIGLDLIVVSDGVYKDAGNKDDLTKFFGVISWLKQADWFVRYVTKWTLGKGPFGNIKEDLREQL